MPTWKYYFALINNFLTNRKIQYVIMYHFLQGNVFYSYFSAKLLVVSGYFDYYVTTSEVIDLMDPMNVCEPWADHPTGTFAAAGALVDNSLFICGGNTPSAFYSNDCHLISPTNAEATISLNVGSKRSAAVEHHGSMYYMGGFSKYT